MNEYFKFQDVIKELKKKSIVWSQAILLLLFNEDG